MELSPRLRSLFIGFSPTWMPLRVFGSHARCHTIFLCVRASLHCRMPSLAAVHKMLTILPSNCENPKCLLPTLQFSKQSFIYWKSCGTMYHNPWKLYEIQISVTKNKVLLEHSHGYFLHMASCALQNQDLSNHDSDRGCIWLIALCCYLVHYKLEQVVAVTAW